MRRWGGRLLLLALAAVGLASAPAASAHTRSESESLWEVGGDKVDLVITFAEAETRPLAKGGKAPSDAQMHGYIAARVYPVADGRRCRLVPPVETLSAVAGLRKYDLTFACPPAARLQVHSTAFSDVTPSHTNFAQIQNTRTGELSEQLITRDRATVDAVGGEGRLAHAGFLDFIKMGMMHIFTGVDHMSFLLGLVLISRRLKDLLFVVTGFTIGHSLTLALAVTGVLRPHAEYIDALVALTIALIGMENIAVATRRPVAAAAIAGGGLLLMTALRLSGLGSLPALLLFGAALFTASYLMTSGSLPNAGRLRMVITVVFGLIHGFGFASNLLEMQLPTGRLAELLVGFNLGVEVGQVTLVLGALLVVWLLVRLRLAPPRAIVVEACSAVLVGLGAYWFAARSFI
jgi:hypothetical protein